MYMYLKMGVAVLIIFGLVCLSLSDDNVLDLFPEFAELKQNFQTTTADLSTNVQTLHSTVNSVQTIVTSLQQPKPLCQNGAIEKQYGEQYKSITHTITFDPAFTHTPAFVWGLDLVDNHNGRNLRINVEIIEQNQNRLRLKLKTWHNSILYNARIRWMACPKNI